MAAAELTVCGPPSLRLDGQVVPEAILPRKSLALIIFLAIEPGRQSRDALATLLWGDSPQEKARASLRQALRHLRRTLGPLVDANRSGVCLQSGVEVDLSRFLQAEEAEAALTVDVARFLEGFTPRHAPGFEEWADRTRAVLIARCQRLLKASGQAALARRDWRGALALGERWLGLDPVSTGAAHLVIESRYLAGDTAGALDAFARFAATCQRELGTAPDSALGRLVQRIQAGGATTPAAEAAGQGEPAFVSLEPGLVGRQREWEALQQAWLDAERSNGRVAVIEGEAGAGKSRLAEDFCRWVTARGGQVARTGAWESGQTTRYATLVTLVRAAIEHPGVAGADPTSLGVVARLVPELRRRFPSIPAHEGDPGTAVLEEAVADLLLAVAEDHPLLVVVDDIQWCDAETSTVLHYLVRRLALAPVLWCVTLTLGEATADAPALRVVRALRALPAAVRLRLAPLTEAEVEGVIRQLGRVGPEGTAAGLARRVHEVSGGNPFYVVELLKSCVAEGWVVHHSVTGEWVIPGQEELLLPAGAVTATVQEAIARRLARLPEMMHQLLMTLAVAEQGLAADVLSHVHGLSRLRVASLGEELIHRQLAREADGRYCCRHPLIAQVVRDTLGPARRRELHRAIALSLLAAATGHGTLASPGEVAHHAERGGERGLAFEHALLAAEIARGHGHRHEAMHWLDVAARHAASPDEVAIVDRATAELLVATDDVAPRRPGERRGYHSS